jgi:hypothetical protein
MCKIVVIQAKKKERKVLLQNERRVKSVVLQQYLRYT